MILNNLYYLNGLFKRFHKLGFLNTINEFKDYYNQYMNLLKKISYIPNTKYKAFLVFNYCKITSLVPDIDRNFLIEIVPKMFAKNYLAHKINPLNEKWKLVEKNKFYKILKDNEIPFPKTYFYTKNGKFYNIEDKEITDLISFENIEMFVKSVNGSGGADVDIITFKSNQKYSDNLIFQEMLKSHKNIYKLCPVKAVQTLRINTYYTLHNEIEYDSYFIKLPPPNAISDNSYTGCIMVSIDPNTGKLQRTGFTKYGNKIGHQNITSHYNSDIKFENYQIPFWKETKILIKKLHSIFPKLRFIGWDIAITNEGPVVIEGNSVGDILFEQLVSGPFYNKKLIQENIN